MNVVQAKPIYNRTYVRDVRLHGRFVLDVSAVRGHRISPRLPCYRPLPNEGAQEASPRSLRRLARRSRSLLGTCWRTTGTPKSPDTAGTARGATDQHLKEMACMQSLAPKQQTSRSSGTATRIAFYARVSTEDQAERDTARNQLLYLHRKYAVDFAPDSPTPMQLLGEFTDD